MSYGGIMQPLEGLGYGRLVGERLSTAEVRCFIYNYVSDETKFEWVELMDGMLVMLNN